MSIDYLFGVGLRDRKTFRTDFFPGSYYIETKTVYTKEGEWKKVEGEKRMNEIYITPWSGMVDDFVRRNFFTINNAELTDNLLKSFEYDGELINPIRMITLEELFNIDNNFIRDGYFLVSDVTRYLSLSPDERLDDEFFAERIPSNVYAEMCKSGKTRKYSEDGDVSFGYEDYMYFAYPDYQSEGYLVSVLQILASSYRDLAYKYPEKEVVLLCWKG